ncbi:hypothetical protein CsSME_00039691 [Camellia sinensis var. sinensis]
MEREREIALLEFDLARSRSRTGTPLCLTFFFPTSINFQRPWISFYTRSSDSGSSVQRRSMMRNLAVGVVTILLVVAQLPSGLTLPSTVPAFLWSPHQDGLLNIRVKEAVNYQTPSSKELANSVMSERGLF